jgi:hypothetical protein
VIGIRGASLHFAGLNTAWMCCGDEDRSRLLLGRYQLTQTVETARAEDAEWRIAVLHHPWEYLAEFDHQAARTAVHQHCDLLLRGHLHQPLSERVVPPDPRRACLELAVGCIYENSQYPNAFQWIELAPGDKRVRVLFRAWLHNAWTVDRNQPNCPEGHAEFDLGAEPEPKRVSGRSAKRVSGRSKAPEVPHQYLKWLKGRCASVELLGQDVQTSVAIELRHVYVPALTHREVVAEAPEEPTHRSRMEPEEQRLVPLLKRIDESSLYVPAPAGAGKSTFCRWAALQSIPDTTTAHPVPAPEEYQEPVPESLRSRLPLLVPLRDFGKDMDCGRGGRSWHRANLEDALAAWLNSDPSPPPDLDGTLLKEHLQAGSAFLLLDGLDEVAISEVRNGITVYPRQLLLSGLADALPQWDKAGDRVLLTSRPYGLDEVGLARLGLPRAPLKPCRSCSRTCSSPAGSTPSAGRSWQQA